MGQVERSRVKRWGALLNSERDAAQLYSRLADAETGEGREIFEELAGIERRHATHWAQKILWPGLMQRYGAVYGFPFALEGFAFFIEAIFLGIYLYGWDRLAPWVHLASGLPIVVAGVASAFFVVAANAWMNTPRGFRLVNERVVAPQESDVEEYSVI